MNDCTPIEMDVWGLGYKTADRMTAAKDQVQLARSCQHGYELRTSWVAEQLAAS